MFSICGTVASICLKRGLATSKSVVIWRQSNKNYFRSSLNKIQRNFSGVGIPPENGSKVNNDNVNSNEILEIMDTPDKIERDHKYYRFDVFV